MTIGAAQRRDDLDRAKGLAIVLVVFGHLVAREGPAGVTWYEPLRQAVYLFHMPFFLFLSGTAAALSGAADTAHWPSLARRRAVRLLGPFAAFGLIILAGKLALGPFLAVDNLPPDPWSGLRALVWDTANSPATSVWYLFALFVFSLATPPLRRAGGFPALLGAAALLYLLPAPPLLYLDRISGYFLFFAAGVLAGAHAARWDAIADRAWKPALAALLATLVLASRLALPHKAGMLAAGLLAMPALHGLARAWASPALSWLGRRVLAIYLLNTICIGLAKAALLPALGWNAAGFPVLAAALMAAGLLGPIAVTAVAGPAWDAARSAVRAASARRAGGWSPALPVSAGSPPARHKPPPTSPC